MTDPSLVALAIAQTLGVRGTGGQSPLEALKEYLLNSIQCSISLLLLIDNFEHVVLAAPMLAELLALAPRLTLFLVITSRAALHVSKEHEFPLQPLRLPDSRAPSAIPRSAFAVFGDCLVRAARGGGQDGILSSPKRTLRPQWPKSAHASMGCL